MRAPWSLRDDLQELLDTYAAAYRAADAAGCAAMFAPECELHSPFAPPARGRSEVEALHRVWTVEGGADKTLAVVGAGGSGDLAWCVAAFSEGPATGSGTSLNVFERQPDGRWLIRICSLNETVPPARQP